MLPFISAIHDKALVEGIDLKTSANKIRDELKDYRELGDLKNAISIRNQQLSSITMFNDQQQRAITIFMNLQNAGMSEKEINGLIEYVNMSNNSHLWGNGSNYSQLPVDN